MLEVRNLQKTYRVKKGAPVKAIDGVSLKLPDTGMVFLLGKSGSGKSTLLNLLGGLDQCDEGEILIQGVSSKQFNQAKFDSYRNTYLGFIFQEYNLLDEFTVGANVALAIELQGRRAENEEINRILTEVDLTGYGNRRTNELSGGQKQRVAIARALVKNPNIIMADEPTGALDSKTGKQIFDILKRLSKDKLVLVVSHDREFAEQYADRIIELADGRVVSDLEYAAEEESERAELAYEGDTISVPGGYELTEEDRLAINAYLRDRKDGVKLALGEKKKGLKVTKTDESKLSDRASESFRLIKSRLPWRNAFQLGAGALGHKKIRLIFTILLSCIAFCMFGFVDMLAAFDEETTVAQTYYNHKRAYTSVQLEQEQIETFGEGEYKHYVVIPATDEKIAEFSSATGQLAKGVFTIAAIEHYTGDYEYSYGLGVDYGNLYPGTIGVGAEWTEEELASYGYSYIGRFPDGERREIAISEYIAEKFVQYGYRNPSTDSVIQIGSYEELLGKRLSDYTITAVVQTEFDIESLRWIYDNFEENKYDPDKEFTAAYEAFTNSLLRSFNPFIFFGSGARSEMALSVSGWGFFLNETWVGSDFSFDTLLALKDVEGEIDWVDGPKTSLGEKELIVSADLIDGFGLSREQAMEVLKTAFVQFEFRCNGLTSEGVEYRVVGVLKEGTSFQNTMVANDSLADRLQGYSSVIVKLPSSRLGIQSLTDYVYRGQGDFKWVFSDSVGQDAGLITDIIEIILKYLLIVDLVFLLFSMLLFSNYIGTSIVYRKRQIGILRAIGSRGNDVFRIFFAESFVIALINYVISLCGTYLLSFAGNALFEMIGISISLFVFTWRQMVVLLAICLLCAFLASFLPVKKIASKRPVEAIREI